MAKRKIDGLIHNAAELLLCCGPADGIRGDALRAIETIPDGAVAYHEGRIAAVGGTAVLMAAYDATIREDELFSEVCGVI